MPATISDILRTKPELITTTPETRLYEAIDQMFHYDYSQLPVLDSMGKPIGMLTSDSIVRALHHFNAGAREPKDETEKARQIRVRDAMYREIQTCSSEDEVFAVHRQLRDVSGVLVVDDNAKLIGIITGYDTTEYLRQRVQDIVFVQDIEETIKAYVRLAFRQSDGSEDSVGLAAAVAEVSRANTPLAKAVKPILEEYTKIKEGSNAQVDEPLFDQALQQLAVLKKAVGFDDLVLFQYIQLFTKYGMKRYGHAFQLDPKVIYLMLDSVRETRNDLSHLRIDISARQRDELRFCREWLKDYYDVVRAVVQPSTLVEVPAHETDTTQPSIVPTSETLPVSTSVETNSVDEEAIPGEGRYAKLANWLYSLAEDQDRIILSFGQIEKTIGGKLPPSAHEYRSWWANDTSRYRHSGQWLSAGWRTDEVDLPRGRVTFIRLQARERAYAQFFDALLSDLRQVVTYPLYPSTKVGYYWQSITKVPRQAPYAGYTTFSFTRAQRPRVDLYIDTSNRERNKAIFDSLLARREEIETAFGRGLEWERIDEKRASRIALYYDTATTIHASPEQLTALREWGVKTLVQLYQALEGPVREVLHTLDTVEHTVESSAHNGSA